MTSSTDRFQDASQGSHSWPNEPPSGEPGTVLCEFPQPAAAAAPPAPPAPGVLTQPPSGIMDGAQFPQPPPQPASEGMGFGVLSLVSVFIPGLVRATSLSWADTGSAPAGGQALHQEQGIRAQIRLAPYVQGASCLLRGMVSHGNPFSVFSNAMPLCGDSADFHFSLLFIYVCAGSSLLHGVDSLVAVWGLLVAVVSLVAEHGLWGTRASVVSMCGLDRWDSQALQHRLRG